MNISLKTKILVSGRSQIALARDISISEGQLSKYIRGWSNPPQAVKEKIAAALECAVSEIFPLERPGREDKVGAVPVNV